MPQKRRKGKSLLQRIKPLFARGLRRRSKDLGSPTGVAEFWQGNVAQEEQEQHVDGDKQGRHINVENVKANQTHTKVKTVEEKSKYEDTGWEHVVETVAEKDIPSMSSSDEAKSKHAAKSQMLRDFSHPSPKGGDGKKKHHSYPEMVSFPQVSPMSWESTSYPSDEVEKNCEKKCDKQEEESICTFFTPLTSEAKSNVSDKSKPEEDKHPGSPHVAPQSDSTSHDNHPDCIRTEEEEENDDDEENRSPNSRDETDTARQSDSASNGEYLDCRSEQEEQSGDNPRDETDTARQSDSTSRDRYLNCRNEEEEEDDEYKREISRDDAIGGNAGPFFVGPGRSGKAAESTEVGGETEQNEPEGKPVGGNEARKDSDERSIDEAEPSRLGPEELFAQGEVLVVGIVGGKYETHKKGQIVGIQKRVKVMIQHENGTTTSHWLARDSLAFRGEAFPPYGDKMTAQNASDTKVEKDAAGASEPDTSKSNDFKRNDRVRIVGGKYQKQETGTVLEVKTSIKVAIDGLSGKEAWLSRKSLMPITEGQTNPDSTAGIAVGKTTEQPSNNAQRPSIANPKSSGRKSEPNTTAPKPKPSGRKSGPKTTAKLASLLQSDEDWRLVDGTKGGSKWGRRKAVKIRLETDPAEDNLLSHWMQSRVKVTEIGLDKAELKEPIPTVVETSDGSKFELVVSKIQSDGERAAPPGGGAMKCIQLYYCQVAGPGLQTVSLQQELERIADFGSLDPDKVCARLELFLSPVYKFKTKHLLDESHAIFMLKTTAFRKIEEKGNEGCGFICKDLLTDILGGRKLAEQAYAIQVRGNSGFGLFKGMLMSKAMAADEPPIQIPQSMLKLGPPRANNAKKQAFLVVTRNGIHPNSTNLMIDRLLSGVGTTKTFRKQKVEQKKFSLMFKQLLIGLKVPKDTCEDYIKASKKEENLQHAFVVGLADPTCGELPHGSVYIPGLSHQGEIIVSRSPCIETADGRLVPVVTSKPNGMSGDSWVHLESLPFGSIIFSEPRPDETPMPVMIADGDLDGDLFFICWNEQILNTVQAEPMIPLLGYDDDDGEKVFDYREDWFSEAQLRMSDAATTQTLSEAIGKLYNKAKEIAENSDQGMDDKDYKFFAAAYKQALKIGKHGGKISLPARLHEALPPKYGHILEDTAELL